MALWLRLAGVAFLTLLPRPYMAPRCDVAYSDPADQPGSVTATPRMVAAAPVVVVTSSVDSTIIKKPRRFLMVSTGVRFRVTEVLKGTLHDSLLTLSGIFVSHDEFNTGPVPYRYARESAMRGACFTTEYRRGATYLLFLSATDGALDIGWAPLLPVNEQLHGPDDPWLQWVRGHLAP